LGEANHIEAMLHLAAMSVAAGAAYIGLDHIRLERDRFRQALQSTQLRIASTLNRLDVMRDPEQAKLKDMFNTSAVHVLCHVAQVDIKLGWRRPIHAVIRQWYVPMLNYFRRRADRAVVGNLLLMSLLSFFAITGATIWEMGLPGPLVAILYFFYILTIVWIFFTVTVSFRLHSISDICQALEERVNLYVQEVHADAAKTIAAMEHAPLPIPPSETTYDWDIEPEDTSRP
jgi:hypothetical protein